MHIYTNIAVYIYIYVFIYIYQLLSYASFQRAPARGPLTLRGGTGLDEVDDFDPIGHLCSLPDLSEGINVSLANKGEGWRRPQASDEVVLSYVARELGAGRQFERCDKPKLFRLGSGALPPGLESAIVLRFGKGAQGVVTLAPVHAFGEQGRLPLVGANTTVEYNLTLWDWNDIWQSPDGRILFRSLGQPANHSAPAGDSDNMTITISAITVPHPSPNHSVVETVGEDSRHSRAFLAAGAMHMDTIFGMSAEMQEKLKSAAQSLGIRPVYMYYTNCTSLLWKYRSFLSHTAPLRRSVFARYAFMCKHVNV